LHQPRLDNLCESARIKEMSGNYPENTYDEYGFTIIDK
jgi:hypothetical protein